jgi:hypothetical protein
MEIWYANYNPNPSPTTPSDAFNKSPPRIFNRTTLKGPRKENKSQ